MSTVESLNSRYNVVLNTEILKSEVPKFFFNCVLDIVISLTLNSIISKAFNLGQNVPKSAAIRKFKSV